MFFRHPLASLPRALNHLLNQSIASDYKLTLPSPEPKHVRFDANGIYVFRFFDGAHFFVALLLEDKETRPSTLKIDESGKTIDFKSATWWTSSNWCDSEWIFIGPLILPFTTLITDPRYYNSETETIEDFPIRTCVLLLALIVVYNSIIQGSLEVTEEDLQAVPTERKIKLKLAQNPLQQLLLTLAVMLHVASNRSQELETEKNMQGLTILSPVMPRPFPSESSSSLSQSIAQPYPFSRLPSSFETLHCFLDDVRASFQYTVRLDDSHILAIADGTLQPKSDKRSDPVNYCIWTKQHCTPSFEVIPPLLAWLIVG